MIEMKSDAVKPYTDTAWTTLYKISAMACIIMLLLIPIQIIIFAVWPPPSNVTGWFTLFESNWLLGLISMDFLYLINNALLILIYLGLYFALKKDNESWMAIAVVVGFIGIAAYYASNMSFEMLSLSSQYAAASTDAQKSMLLAAGQAMLSIYKGTAFNVYYILNDITLLIISFVMLKSNTFCKATAYTGLLSGLLMTIPSTAGTIGVVFSIASLMPWMVFIVLIARRLLRLCY